jgi:hypothetical protein
MVSSLLHVLVVTPVIFMWLREGEVRREERAAEQQAVTHEENPEENKVEEPQLAKEQV